MLNQCLTALFAASALVVPVEDVCECVGDTVSEVEAEVPELEPPA